MTRLVIFAFLAVSAITGGVIAVIPRTQGISNNVPKIETVGLAEQGLTLVGPNDSGFEGLMTAHLRQTSHTSRTPPNTAGGIAVFVVNNSKQSVAAFNVRFEMVKRDGEIITHSVAHSAPLTTISDNGLLMEDISPKGNRPLSFDLPNSGVHIDMGGRARDGAGTDIVRQLPDTVKINAFLDGVLFVDGTFVGPDTMNYFPRLRAEVEASQDLKHEIRQLLETNVQPEAILRHIEALYHRRSGEQPPVGKDADYLMMKTKYAGTVLAMIKTGGVKAVSEFLAREASKPQVNFRKS